jgi:hypothetical protein
MNRRTGSLVAAILVIAAVPTAAQWLNYPTPGIPRTALEDGGLTLSGLGLANAPLTALSESPFTLGGTHFRVRQERPGRRNISHHPWR